MSEITFYLKNEKQFVLLEFQGEFEINSNKIEEKDLKIEKEEDNYNILINNTIIAGKKIKLDKKLYLVKKIKSGGEIISIVEYKILFGDRPIPLIQN